MAALAPVNSQLPRGSLSATGGVRFPPLPGLAARLPRGLLSATGGARRQAAARLRIVPLGALQPATQLTGSVGVLVVRQRSPLLATASFPTAQRGKTPLSADDAATAPNNGEPFGSDRTKMLPVVANGPAGGISPSGGSTASARFSPSGTASPSRCSPAPRTSATGQRTSGQRSPRHRRRDTASRAARC
jgi:hypothetical protein